MGHSLPARVPGTNNPHVPSGYHTRPWGHTYPSFPDAIFHRIASLEAQLSSLLAMMQQTQQAVLPVTQQQPQLPQQPLPPQPLLPQPPLPPPQPLQPSSQQVLPPDTPQPNVFIPPISLNPASGMSLDLSFPHVDPALRLAIAKHEFRPGHLYKLDSTIKEKPTAKSFKISDDGAFTQRERDGSPKDYPSFRALLDPLVI
ncbi:hypothetical protein JB92DRAFT_2825547 [Gautieria morchelliformis]|nr:hypothetical protein JB92DRAFT_2825547 [Gautieria morchelliformis]